MMTILSAFLIARGFVTDDIREKGLCFMLGFICFVVALFDASMSELEKKDSEE